MIINHGRRTYRNAGCNGLQYSHKPRAIPKVTKDDDRQYDHGQPKESTVFIILIGKQSWPLTLAYSSSKLFKLAGNENILV